MVLATLSQSKGSQAVQLPDVEPRRHSPQKLRDKAVDCQISASVPQQRCFSVIRVDSCVLITTQATDGAWPEVAGIARSLNVQDSLCSEVVPFATVLVAMMCCVPKKA